MGVDAGQGFTAKQVQDLTGLTGRQLNDWDGRGALPHTREGIGWRRFNPKQLFILMVCTELRRRFGVSVERLKSLMEFMNQEDANHFEAAAHLMGIFGTVWLMTDFEDLFVMDSVAEFDDMWNNGYFDGGEPSGLAFLRVNPIVNSILGSLEIETIDHHSDVLNQLRSEFGVRSAAEFNALQMIRSGDFQSVEVTAPDGEVETIRATAKPDVTERLEDLLRRHAYQTLTVITKGGRVVHMEQQITLKREEDDTTFKGTDTTSEEGDATEEGSVP